MMLSGESASHDWHMRFIKEAEDNARLRAELEETRAKYDTLLEVSLQQMASRIDEFAAATEKFRRMSPSTPLSFLPPSSPSISSSSSSSPSPLTNSSSGNFNSNNSNSNNSSNSNSNSNNNLSNSLNSNNHNNGNNSNNHNGNSHNGNNNNNSGISSLNSNNNSNGNNSGISNSNSNNNISNLSSSMNNNNSNNNNGNNNNNSNSGNSLNTSSTNLHVHALSSSDENHKDKSKPNTPNKAKKPFFGLGGGKKNKDKKEKELNKGTYQVDEDIRTDFVLPLAPSTSYQHLPRLPVCPLVSRNHIVIAGPSGPAGPMVGDDNGSAHYVDIVAGRSISTYPHIPGNPSRDGDPIADRFSAHVFENRIIAAVADGCNWGAKPKEAAQKANSAFIEFVNASHDSITDVKKAGAVLLNAFEYAHNSIMEGKLAFWDAGTTTLLGGVLLEINKGTDKWTPQWEFVCASVGDCKAFCYSNGEITDITQGNRLNASDPRDCGGRLGPHLDEGKPDLRNLNLFCAPCDDGDMIIIVTDGIHDNLDPQHLGKVPKDMPKEFNLAGDKWDEVDPAKAIYAKNAFITELLLKLMKSGDGEPPTPKEVAERLVNHCVEVTQKSRDYMENNQGKRLPEDYIEFPGKMDHTTCLCFRVGRFPTLPERGNIVASASAPGQLPALTMPSSLLIPSVSPSAAAGGAASGNQPDSPSSPKHFDNWTKISPSVK